MWTEICDVDKTVESSCRNLAIPIHYEMLFLLDANTEQYLSVHKSDPLNIE